MAETSPHTESARDADADVARELAELRAALQAAQDAAADARQAAAAAAELNVQLLANVGAAPSSAELDSLRAGAALAEEMAATRLWRWSAGPRRVYGALRRLARR